MPTPVIAASLAVLLTLLAGCGQTLDQDDPAAGPEPEADTDLDADAEQGPDASDEAGEQSVGDCGMPDFRPRSLPWDGDPEQPDEIQARGELTTALVWYHPEDEGSLQVLKGQRPRTGVEPEQTITVRGQEAILWWTGGRPGLLSAHWVEGENPCEQYMVVLGPANDTSELLELLPE